MNSTRNKFATLDQPALWRPIRNPQVSIRKYGGGFPFIKSGILQHSTLTTPVFRYAKNFTKFKKEFSVFMFTHESDISEVEKLFGAVVKKLKSTDVLEVLSAASMSTFKYADSEYGGDK